ncbi:MAG TPA: MerC domain-containing protein [Bryobacteraceae bacterium]|jgi:hypothetical protein|nr:MerC domain-containing protein [Bryobacteraceae bacterium]
MRINSSLVDRAAMFVAAACGLHCICFPLLLALSAASGFVHLLSKPLEIVFVVSAFVLGGVNLSFSWWSGHHKPGCLVLFALGMTLILTHDQISGEIASACVSVFGGVLVATAHFRNMSLTRRCACCPPSSSSCGQ